MDKYLAGAARGEYGKLSLRFIEPDEALPFIQSLSLKRLNYILWDIPPVRSESFWLEQGLLPGAAKRIHRAELKERIRVLMDLLARSPEIGLWIWNGEPYGLLWSSPLSLGAAALSVHFHFADQAFPLFPAMLDQYLEATEASALLGLIPAIYREVRKVIESRGFSRTRVPRACHMARLGKIVDGYLYYLELSEWRKKRREGRS